MHIRYHSRRAAASVCPETSTESTSRVRRTVAAARSVQQVEPPRIVPSDQERKKTAAYMEEAARRVGSIKHELKCKECVVYVFEV